MADVRVAERGFLNLTNARLLERCRDGDQHAWSALVGRYERLVYAIALREGVSKDAAGDVAQDTFAELLGSIESIREPERLGQWLATVCRRGIWKRRGTKNPATIELREDVLSATTDFSDDLAQALEIYDAVHALGEPCRALIVDLFFDPTEPDYASIAVRLGRPPGSIGPLRGRCLARLRELLIEEGIDA